MNAAGSRTPSQTIGPFFAVGLPWADGPFVVPAGMPGATWLRGQVLDGHGDPVPDAMVETWQADPGGRLDRTGEIQTDDPAGFRGFARSCVDAEGRYEILTVKPGPVRGPDGLLQAPHIDVSVFARGLLKRVVTRIYFADEPDANAADAVLASIADPTVRATLIAQPSDDGYRFDVRLQGERETAFFDV
jgi:protocatechuate 3,4-dioxygenase, alpha subunit